MGIVAKAPRCLVVCLIGLQACLGSVDPELAEQQQAEVIEVHGCRPGSWDLGDGVCIDPWPGGGGGGPTGGERDPGGPGGGGGGPRGAPAPASKWTCDASCNVEQVDPGARCPDRVTGRGTGTSSQAACNAAKRDANSNVPRGCRKRHCNCRCTKGTVTVTCDDPIVTITHE
jgi:hypothetical protein